MFDFEKPSMRQHYELAKTRFTTVDAVKKHLHSILKLYKEEEVINESSHHLFIDELLHCHPAVEIKFRGSLNNKYRKASGNSIILCRDDGTETDISYTKCLKKNRLLRKELTQEERVQLFWEDLHSAMREAVIEQIYEFRDDFWHSTPNATCAVSNIPIIREETHVDHITQFQYLMISFLDENPVSKDLVIEPLSGRGKCLVEGEFKRKWEKYHEDRASLRIVHKVENLRLKAGIKNVSYKVKWNLVGHLFK